MRSCDCEEERKAAANAIAAAERRAIRTLIERIFAEAETPGADTLADWLARDPPADRPRAN